MTDPMNEREFQGTRSTLRTLGPVLAVVGLICLIVAMVNVFGSAGSFGGPPKLFWLPFVGMPLLAVGLGMTKAGYAGKIARYYGREVGPAVSATFNEVAQDSAPGVRAVSGAVRDGMADEPGSRCSACDSENDADAKFCAACGEPMRAIACGSCGHPAKTGARFCDECGSSLVG